MDKFKVSVYSNLVQLGVNDEYYLRLTEAELDSLLGKLIDAKMELEEK